MSLENLSDAELEAVANGDFSKLSDATLATLSGEAPARSLGEQLKRGAGLAGRAVVQGMAAPVTAVGDFVSGLANLGSALSGSEARVPVPSQRPECELPTWASPQSGDLCPLQRR